MAWVWRGRYGQTLRAERVGGWHWKTLGDKRAVTENGEQPNRKSGARRLPLVCQREGCERQNVQTPGALKQFNAGHSLRGSAPCRYGESVESATYSDAALVLVGHGSTVKADSSAPVYQHAAALRARGLFAEVVEAFWKVEPRLLPAVHGIRSPRVFIVPLFISAGYFTQEVLPRALGFEQARKGGLGWVLQPSGQRLYYCDPIGTHPSMARVLLARAREVVEQHPFPCAPLPLKMALCLAGHGTLRNAESRRAIEAQVDAIRAMRIYQEVHPLFLEEEPRVSDLAKLVRPRDVVVVPFFMSDGMHSRGDIPVLLGEARAVVEERLRNGQPPWRNPTEKAGHRIWYGQALGSHPRVSEVILERVREMAEAG